jgi:hypothetical protein
MRINIHGIIGIFAIAGMMWICMQKDWQVPWLYVVTSCLLYSGVVISTSYVIYKNKATTPIQLLWGSHLSFLLLAGGLLINAQDFSTLLGIFVSAIALGTSIPFMLVHGDS